MNAITVRGLTKHYGKRVVVNDISFDIPAGETFALLGMNGAGKTTTVEILEGFRRFDSGTANVLGEAPGSPRTRARIGVMPQVAGVHTAIRPEEILRLYESYFGDAIRPEELLDHYEIPPKTLFRRLSQGQQQSLSLALALIGRPSLIFLDEPTSFMDVVARRKTWSTIKESPATVFLTTHSLTEVEAVADRVGILHGGRLIAVDSPAALSGSKSLEDAFIELTDQ